MLHKLLEKALNILPRRGRVIIEYYPGLPYRRLSLNEIARLTGISTAEIEELHNNVRKIIAKNIGEDVLWEENRIIVKDPYKALKIISILREHMLTVNARIEFYEEIDEEIVKDIASDYVKLVYIIEEYIGKQGIVNKDLVRLWIELATAIEILSGKVSEETARIFQVPFIPISSKKSNRS